MVGKSIAENLGEVRERIQIAAAKAGRHFSEITLVAVSKTKPLALINEASAAGQVDFGENYVQEAMDKREARPDLNWHFIGSLQSNKVKQVVGKFSLIHSVDRLKLAEAISHFAQERKILQDVLLQINIGDEQSKSGASRAEAIAMLEAHLPGLRWRGLMALPPLSDDLVVQRNYVRQLRELAHEIRENHLRETQRKEFSILSIGTTHDYEAAILEGATHVRIGSAIFGERNLI